VVPVTSSFRARFRKAEPLTVHPSHPPTDAPVAAENRPLVDARLNPETLPYSRRTSACALRH
jgi:hypothetical protein